MMHKEELSKIKRGESHGIFSRQRLNISRQNKLAHQSENIYNSKISKEQNMADLFNTICKKKTFFICITVICIGALIAAIVVASVVKVDKAPSECEIGDTTIPCGNDTFYRFYGTKTDYIIGRGTVPDAEIPPEHPGCSPLVIFLVSRHAIRYPDEDDIIEMQTILPDLRDQIVSAAENNTNSLCANTIKELKIWELTMQKSDDNRISKTGEQESQELGERLKKKFPSLLSVPYTDTHYEFGYTNKIRTLETANAFAKGIFGATTKLPDHIMDDVLSFHKECEANLKKNGWKKSKPIEEVAFVNSPLFKKTLEDIGSRLQINATLSTAKLMLRTCQFEFSIFGSSPWCALFSESNVKAFEYMDDLNDYYNDGYGEKINYEQACPMIKEILSEFRLAKQDGSSKAMLLFSHAGAMKKIAAHLSLFKDSEHLKGTQYCQVSDRKWRSSKICPFNGNFYMVLYKCNTDYKVETFYNEKLVKLDGCSSEFCSWEEFENRFNGTSEECKLSEICTRD